MNKKLSQSVAVRTAPVYIVLSLICFSAAYTFFQDFLNSRPSSADNLTNGQVIGRELVEINWLVTRPRLTIEITETDEVISAILSSDAIDDIGDSVTFYYSGDPAKEVHLLEETNPFWIGLFLLLGPLAFAGVMIYLIRRDIKSAQRQRADLDVTA